MKPLALPPELLRIAEMMRDDASARWLGDAIVTTGGAVQWAELVLRRE